MMWWIVEKQIHKPVCRQHRNLPSKFARQENSSHKHIHNRRPNNLHESRCREWEAWGEIGGEQLQKKVDCVRFFNEFVRCCVQQMMMLCYCLAIVECSESFTVFIAQHLIARNKNRNWIHVKTGNLIASHHYYGRNANRSHLKTSGGERKWNSEKYAAQTLPPKHQPIHADTDSNHFFVSHVHNTARKINGSLGIVCIWNVFSSCFLHFESHSIFDFCSNF